MVLSLVLKSRQVLEAGEIRSESGEQGDKNHRSCVIWQKSYYMEGRSEIKLKGLKWDHLAEGY